MARATGREGRPVHEGKVTSWLSKVFALNPAGLNWPRAVLALDVMLVPPGPSRLTPAGGWQRPVSITDCEG